VPESDVENALGDGKFMHGAFLSPRFFWIIKV